MTPADAHVHGHAHGPTLRGHAERAQEDRGRLLLVLASGVVIMLVEVVAGIWANSLVLLADAAHYLTDVVAIALAFIAAGWAMKAATKRKTFGYHRAEVLAAFVNSIALWAVSAFLVFEAWRRLRAVPEVDGTVVLVVGLVSLAGNLALATFLRRGSHGSINVRVAYAHILSDVLGSAAAVATGVAVRFWGLHAADPVLTLLITGLIVVFTWRLTRETMHILLEGTPRGIELDEVAAQIRAVPDVRDLHDLHVWTLTSGRDSLSVHVVLGERPRDDRVVHEIESRMRDRFNIRHVTVQVEDPTCLCEGYRCEPG